MYTYKALLVKVEGTDYEKLCSTPKEAELFLKKCNLLVTMSSVKHLERIYGVTKANHINHLSEPCHSFSDGSDCNNPTISIYNYTGNYSKREFSPYNIEQICDKVAEKYRKVEEDFKINMSLILIEGGFNWRWSDQQQVYFAIHNFSVRPCYYANLIELEEAMDKHVNNLITRYSKNI